MKYPDDLAETVSVIVSDNCKNMVEISVFALTPDDDLIRYHHGLGTDIRNHYKMWDEKVMEQYFEEDDLFDRHPDDVCFKWLREAQIQIRLNLKGK